MLSFFQDKKVFLTGHTGFKGAWLLQILHLAGAKVKGFSLAPTNDLDLFNQIQGEHLCESSIIEDVRNAKRVQEELLSFEPDFVFHLAAQALVRESYDCPQFTFETNVMGTIHILEALKMFNKKCTTILITTDKVYENLETKRAFVETDKLGGYDPYSASKAACEIAISSYRNSFFSQNEYAKHQKIIHALRAGNVIGGGDYSKDRIIPDIVKAIENNQPVILRNPKAVRPWQHVLEPLFTYLDIARQSHKKPYSLSDVYNIGPNQENVADVEFLTQQFISYFGKGDYRIEGNQNQPHEAQFLMLDNALLKKDLNWQPIYDTESTIRITAEWYADQTHSALDKCRSQIEKFYARWMATV